MRVRCGVQKRKESGKSKVKVIIQKIKENILVEPTGVTNT